MTIAEMLKIHREIEENNRRHEQEFKRLVLDEKRWANIKA